MAEQYHQVPRWGNWERHWFARAKESRVALRHVTFKTEPASNQGPQVGRAMEESGSWRGLKDKPRQCIKKRKDIYHLVDKDPYIKSMVFPVVMYRCESWTIKKAEHQRINAFKLWC